MQSSTIAFSPSLSLSTHPPKLPARGFSPISFLSPARRRLSNGSAVFSSTRNLGPISCSLKQNEWASGPNPGIPEPESDGVVVRAASEPLVPAESPESKGFGDTLVLGTLFGLWYLFNIYFNIYNKQVLKAFHYPMTVTLVQFTVGSVLVTTMWTLNLYKRPKISGAQLVAILPLAFVHTLGNLFTNMSLGKVAVSFTHTIKAMEPFFSVVLSAMFLGEINPKGPLNLQVYFGSSYQSIFAIIPAVSFTHTIKAMEPFFSVVLSAMFLGEFPTLWVLSSLVPIVGGVGLASMTEASFNWAGFWSAMASNLTNQSRNVLSKKFMVKKEESLDNITLFSIITIMSFFLMAPTAIFMEGIKFTPSHLQAAGVNVNQLYTRSFIAALCFHAYQQVSYMILQRVSPVTHSVGNCVKRVVVIVTSVIFFRTPVSPINSLGTGLALAGVFLYSRVKRIKPKTKAA